MLAEDVAGFTHDPLGYCMYSFPWEEAGPLADVKGPRAWQCDTLEDIREHLEDPAKRFEPLMLAVASGHGVGKSALISMIVCWASDTCEDTRVVITANTEQQLRTKTWPEVLKWRGMSITKDWWKPTKTAASPTKLCKTATSSGIEVISTFSASAAPIKPPMPTAAASTPYCCTWLMAVTETASSMPTMPKPLPRRAEA